MHADFLQKNAYGLVYAHLFNCAAASLPRRLLRTCLESCANIEQAVVYCPPYRPPSCRQSVARRVRSRNPSKSTLAHDAVATAVLHKHHLIIRVGAGLIQFVYRSHLRLATEATRNRNAFLPFFARVSCIVWEDLLSCVRWKFQVSLWRQRECASAVMRCECFYRHHHLMLHQNRTSLVCQLVLVLLHYRWGFKFRNEESCRCLIRMRRTLVLLVNLSMESLVACFLALLLEWDYGMFARLERRVVSAETDTGVDQMQFFDVWQWFVICHSHSSLLRRCVSLCQWRRLEQMEGLSFDLEAYAYFCIRWRSSCTVALA